MRLNRGELLAMGILGSSAAPTYTISGTITDGASAVAGVTVALGALSAVSGADGTYTISSIPAGTSGTLTATKTGWTFGTISIAAMSGNLTGQNIAPTYFQLTGTTTGAQTLTLQGMTVATAKTVVVDWGDNNTNTYTAGAGVRSHAYAGAGTYAVKIYSPANVTLLDLQDTKITATINANNPMPSALTSLNLYNLTGFSWTVGDSAPMPTGLTYLHLTSVAGITWTVGASAPIPESVTNLRLENITGFSWTVGASAPMPTGLTYLYLSNFAGLTWTVGASAPMPTGLTFLRISYLANVTWAISASAPMPTGLNYLTIISANGVTLDTWTAINSIITIQWESNLSQAAVDAILLAVWTNKANFTHAAPSLDLLGGTNYEPSGVYQAGSGESGLPVTGKEYAYDLVNGTYTSAGPEWTVNIALRTFSMLGDSIEALGTWPGLMITAYKSGTSVLLQHAVNGARIIPDMDSQTAAAALDVTADYVIICLGTNDDNAGDMGALQAEVEENIAELKTALPGATIYYMNVLPRWTNNTTGPVVDKSNIRTAIAAACTAQSITCWDTFTTPWITQAQTSDGLHLATAGANAVRDAVIALLPA